MWFVSRSAITAFRRVYARRVRYCGYFGERLAENTQTSVSRVAFWEKKKKTCPPASLESLRVVFYDDKKKKKNSHNVVVNGHLETSLPM